MKNSDEELQKQIDAGMVPNDGVESQAYLKVFDALKREPDYSLPSSFADRILILVDAKEKARENTRDKLWFGLGLVPFLIATLVISVLTDFKLSAGAFRFVSGYSGLILFGVIFILGLHWIDKKLIQPGLSTRH
jgi:hypothetical protein